jgi:hypothetical protein
MSTTHDHQGIPCECPLNSRWCKAVSRVLSSIAQEFPADLERLRRRVLAFRELSPDVNEVMAACFRRPERSGEDLPWWQDHETPGFLDLLPHHSLDPVATAAHELGHAATTGDDLDDRSALPAEWASECCADFYAHRWGFGLELRAARPYASADHHGPCPNAEFTSEADGVVDRYRVTADFRVEFVQRDAPDGTVVETAAERNQRLSAGFQSKSGASE